MPSATPAGRAAAILAGVALVAAAGTGGGCGRKGRENTGAPAAGSSTVAEGRTLLSQGRLDEALQRLQQEPSDPQSLYLQGRVWAKRAETAPLPTPPPPPSPLPKGAVPAPAPEFKPEELQAIALYEKALAARPDLAEAHVALAELLAPHALRRQARLKAAATPASRSRRAPPSPPEPDAGGVDYGVERVVRAYEFALKADATSQKLPEALIGFGIQAGDLQAAERGHQELVRRIREKPEPFVRYGDFLLNHKQDPDAAIEQYRQALIWRPDDEAVRARVAEIYIARGAQHLARQQFALAEQQLKQAERFITDRGSPQGQRLAQYTSRLREIR